MDFIQQYISDSEVREPENSNSDVFSFSGSSVQADAVTSSSLKESCVRQVYLLRTAKPIFRNFLQEELLQMLL